MQANGLGRRAFAGLALTGLGLGLAAPRSARAASDKTLRAVVAADLKIVDPTWTTAYVTIRHGYLVYDTLFALDSKYDPKPQMVESFTVSPDALSYAFKLRPGLKWHDGTPVLASDCVASLKRWAQRNPMGQHMTAALDSYGVVDDQSFTIKLKDPFGLVLEALAGAEAPAFMMPARIANIPLEQQITDPIGSGPFVFKKDEWQPGNKAVYVKNAAYVPRQEPADYLAGGKVVKVDRVEWLYIPDNNTALSALQSGEVDYFEAPPLDFVDLMKSDSDITVLTIDPLGVEMIGRMNSLFPPFNNYLARQAMVLLMNQDETMQAVVGNPDYFKTYCPTYFMCGSANATDAGAAPFKTTNIDKAKGLLKQAGYNGETLVVLQPTDRPQYNAAVTVMASQLRKAGVTVDLQAQDWSTITGRRAKMDPPDKGGWNLFVTSAGGPDMASPAANIWFNSACKAANPGWPCDPKLTAMVDAWTREPDAAKRHAMIPAIQEEAYTSIPYIPLGQFTQPIAFRSNIKGVLVAGVPVYWNIEKT